MTNTKYRKILGKLVFFADPVPRNCVGQIPDKTAAKKSGSTSPFNTTTSNGFSHIPRVCVRCVYIRVRTYNFRCKAVVPARPSSLTQQVGGRERERERENLGKKCVCVWGLKGAAQYSAPPQTAVQEGPCDPKHDN